MFEGGRSGGCFKALSLRLFIRLPPRPPPLLSFFCLSFFPFLSSFLLYYLPVFSALPSSLRSFFTSFFSPFFLSLPLRLSCLLRFLFHFPFFPFAPMPPPLFYLLPFDSFSSFPFSLFIYIYLLRPVLSFTFYSNILCIPPGLFFPPLFPLSFCTAFPPYPFFLPDFFQSPFCAFPLRFFLPSSSSALIPSAVFSSGCEYCEV